MAHNEDLKQSEILIPSAIIQKRVKALAKKLAAEVNPKRPPILLGLVNGAARFTMDLNSELYDLGIDAEYHLPRASSYGVGTKSSGKVKIQPGMSNYNMSRRDEIWLVDDVADTRLTISKTLTKLWSMGFKKIKIIVAVEKPMEVAQIKTDVDYSMFEIPNFWVEGYGMDTAGKGRGNRNIIARYRNKEEQAAIIAYREKLLSHVA